MINTGMASYSNLITIKEKIDKRDAEAILLLTRQSEEIMMDIMYVRLMLKEVEGMVVNGFLDGMNKTEEQHMIYELECVLELLEKRKSDIESLISKLSIKKATSDKKNVAKDITNSVTNKAKYIGGKVNKENIDELGKSILSGIQDFCDFMKNIEKSSVSNVEDEKKEPKTIKINIE